MGWKSLLPHPSPYCFHNSFMSKKMRSFPPQHTFITFIKGFLLAQLGHVASYKPITVGQRIEYFDWPCPCHIPILVPGEFHPSHVDPHRIVAEQRSTSSHLEQTLLELCMTRSVGRPPKSLRSSAPLTFTLIPPKAFLECETLPSPSPSPLFAPLLPCA